MAKVLVVDDMESEVLRTAKLLRDAGHECVKAFDGDQAVALARSEKPKLILMDVVMGEHNGFQACRRLKEMPETKDIPIVFVTKRAEDNDRWWANRIGAADYLIKPVDAQKLIDTIERFV